ncbi:MAG: Arm DNA-binding domain-containing protein [Pseudomonadales bacterium]
MSKKLTATNLRKAANHRSAILDAIERGVFDYSVTFPNSKKVDMQEAQLEELTSAGDVGWFAKDKYTERLDLPKSRICRNKKHP